MHTMHRRKVAASAAGVVASVLLCASCSGDGDKATSGSPSKTVSATAPTDKQILDQGLQQQAAGDSAAAKKTFEALLKKDPKNKYALYNLGVIAAQAGDAPTAVKDYQQTLLIDPAYAPALYNLAILTDQAGDSKGAVALYRRAIKADPKDANSHFNLGLLLRALGQPVEALIELNTAIQLDPKLKSRLTTPTEAP